MGKSVFICYANPDEKIAGKMCGFLEKKGIQCFYRHRDIPSDDRDNSMFEVSSISDATCVVVIFSESFVKSGKIEMVNASANKCVVFTIENLDLKFNCLAGARKINAINHPEKKLGHILPEIKNFIGYTKKNEYRRGRIVGIFVSLSLIVLAFYLCRTNEVTAEERKFPEYIDISLTNFEEKRMLASQSPITETDLPFVKAKYGYTLQDWQQCMKGIADNAGLGFETRKENGIELPGYTLYVELDFSTGLHLILEPTFNKKGMLNTLSIRVKRKTDFPKYNSPLIDEVMTEIIAANGKYSNYEKYHVIDENQNHLFYCLIKNNHLITIRDIDSYNVLMVFNNVPDMSEGTWAFRF